MTLGSGSCFSNDLSNNKNMNIYYYNDGKFYVLLYYMLIPRKVYISPSRAELTAEPVDKLQPLRVLLQGSGQSWVERGCL